MPLWRSWTNQAYPNLIYCNRLPGVGILPRGSSRKSFLGNCARPLERCARHENPEEHRSWRAPAGLPLPHFPLNEAANAHAAVAKGAVGKVLITRDGR
jgi:hypothetical protein